MISHPQVAPYDLVFIDGDHHYEMVKNDTQKVFEHLVNENSIVVWHDYARDPETVRYEVLAGILEGIPEKFRDHLYHFENSLCAIYINKDFEKKFMNSIVRPDHYFEVNIKQVKGER